MYDIQLISHCEVRTTGLVKTGTTSVMSARNAERRLNKKTHCLEAVNAMHPMKNGLLKTRRLRHGRAKNSAVNAEAFVKPTLKEKNNHVSHKSGLNCKFSPE